MNLENKLKDYEKLVSFIYELSSNTTLAWLSRYPVSSPNRKHLLQIVTDISKQAHCRIVEQGAAEGIICRVLQDMGHDVSAVDIEPEFKRCWSVLRVSGVVGDCTSLDWWDGKALYDVVIAGVWVACKGKESVKIGKKRAKQLRMIRDNWSSILQGKGVVYFDVNPEKYPIKPLSEIFQEKFSVTLFKRKPRCILKCTKKEFC